MAKRHIKKQRRALENGANVGTKIASRSPKAALSSLPVVGNFDHTGQVLYSGKFV